MRIVIVLLLSIALAACDNGSSANAKYFGVERKEITVTDFNKGALATGYRVLYQGRQYNCRIYYGEVDCKQPGA
ncbi:MAG: hypothetical protein Q8L45_00265 [Xanthomonadaceae bacterium]|nr:hypothetical protein [Xanthomonadaceae bacterium]MDP2184411.1 hypothetical protein [Xanthomonadales bacterium]MDZ4116810.1 hypothetical protein [Xanthomonadaceae bacterium]MDZ4377811.1 hypothetical protein [Xanthomonadaceae bacterium]